MDRKILFAQSYFRVLDSKEENRNQPYPPLGSLIAATYLEKLGFPIRFFDSMIVSDANIIFNELAEFNPEILILYDDEFNFLTKMSLLNMRIHTLKILEYTKKHGIFTIVYTSDAIDYPEIYLNGGSDLVIIGEGETVLEDLFFLLDDRTFDSLTTESFKAIFGVALQDKGQIIKTKKKPLRQNLDDLPDPNYDHFIDLNTYKDIWLKNHGFFSINVSTSRGCTYKCNWCAKPLWGRTYNSYSPIRIVNLFEKLRDKYLVDHIWITDDIFGLQKNWLTEFSGLCQNKQVVIPFKCLSRADLLTKGNTVQNLKDSGCEIIWVGAESGSQKVLDAMEKGVKVTEIIEATEMVKRAGMKIAYFLQLGYLGETWEDLNETRNLVKNNLPDDIGISVSYPLPGTKFYGMVESHLSEKRNWLDSSDLDMLFHGTYSRNFYRTMHSLIHHEYRYANTKKHFTLAKFPKILFHKINASFSLVKIMRLKTVEKKRSKLNLPMI